MKRALLAIGLGLLTVSLLGCPDDPDPTSAVGLYQATGAPPTLTASLIDREDLKEIRMSVGVAMGVVCWDSCEDATTACENMSVTSGDGETLAALPTYRSNGQPTVTLSAVAVGTTQVTVSTICGRKSYRAIVEE